MRLVKADKLSAEDYVIVDRLFTTVARIIRYFHYIGGIPQAKVENNTLYLRVIGENRYLAICPKDQNIFYVGLNFIDVTTIAEYDLDDLLLITQKLEKLLVGQASVII